MIQVGLLTIEQKDELIGILTSRFPEEIYGWQQLTSLTNVNLQTTQEAISKIKDLDQFYFACRYGDRQELFSLFSHLPNNKQREVVRYWSLPKEAIVDRQSPLKNVTPQLKDYIGQLCSTA